MAVTWDVHSLDVTKTVGSLSDVVTTIHWYAFEDVSEGGQTYTGSSYGSTPIADPDSESFVTYADITKDNAIAWVKSALGSDEVTKVETDIATQITAWKTPPTYSGVPWS